MKPTCIVQLSRRHLAIATGFLNEKSQVEVINIFTGQMQSVLKHHSDMIDSLQLVHLSKYTQSRLKSFNSEQANRLRGQGILPNMKLLNPYVRWLISISRDNKIVLWKLFDGKPMTRDLAINLYCQNQLEFKPRTFWNHQMRNSIMHLSHHGLVTNSQLDVSKYLEKVKIFREFDEDSSV